MKKVYVKLNLNIDKLIFKYKNKLIIVKNIKKEICPGKNTSH